MNEVTTKFGIPMKAWSEGGVDPREANDTVMNLAQIIAKRVMGDDPTLKQFSITLIIALVGIIIEAIKLYRDCNKTPAEVFHELQNGFPRSRPIRRIIARRLVKRFIKEQDLANELSSGVILDVFADATDAIDVQKVTLMMGNA